MRKAGMISLGLMLVLFAGLFVGLGAVDQIYATRGIGPKSVSRNAGMEWVPADQPATDDLLHSAAANITGTRGYFVYSAEVGPYGQPGFDFYSPMARTAAFTANQSFGIFNGQDNWSIVLYYTYLDVFESVPEGRMPTDTTVNRIIGSNPDDWTQGEAYERLLIPSLWHGVNLWFTGAAGYPNGLKSAFLVNSTADVSNITMQIDGADAFEVSEDGNTLTIITEAGNVTEELYVYNFQTEEQVAANYSVDGNVISYEIDPEASWNRLVIDPLIYSSYVGGLWADRGNDVAVDAAGNAYVVGYSESPDFPVTAGAYNESYSGSGDVVVFKMNADGSNLIYCTFIGGNETDEGFHIAIDNDGNAYISGKTGYAGGNSFPVTPGSFNESNYAYQEVFVLKLSADGSTLVWSGLLGGSGSENSAGLALDPVTGDVVVGGNSGSTDFKMTSGAYMTTNPSPGLGAAFVARISPDGSTLLNCTFYGGTGQHSANDLAVNSTGYVYFAGHTNSTDIPTPGNPYNDTNSGGLMDIYYGCFSSNLSVLHVAGYIGGSDYGSGDYVYDYSPYIAVDNYSVVLAGISSAYDYPTTTSAFCESLNGSYDVVVSVLSIRLDTLESSTYIGGSALDQPSEVIIDVDRAIYVSGWTDSANFPMSQWPYQDTYNGSRDAFVAKFTYDLEELTYSTFLGGNLTDHGRGMAVLNDSSVWGRNMYLVGDTISLNFPTTVGAFNETYGGNGDIFIAAIEYMEPRPIIQSVSYPNSIEYHQNWTVYANITSLNGVSHAILRYNSTYFPMSNASTPENWNYSASIRTTSTGSNSFTIWTNGTLGNTTETSSYSFYIGGEPQFERISAAQIVIPAAPWTVVSTVTDELTGDSGVAGVWFRLDDKEWESMTGDGDEYTLGARTFEVGTYYWQLKAEDNAGNVAYSPSYKLSVGDATLTSSAAAKVTVKEAEIVPWVPTYKADWGWWVYSFVFGAVILVFALLFGKEEENATVNALIIVLTCTAAGIMAAASLAGISRVFEWPIVAALWGAVGVWALVVVKRKLPAFAAGLAIGSSALGVEMLISSGWNLAVAMYICLAAAGAVWALGPKAKIIPKQRFSIPIAVGVLMAVGTLLGLWYVFI